MMVWIYYYNILLKRPVHKQYKKKNTGTIASNDNIIFMHKRIRYKIIIIVCMDRHTHTHTHNIRAVAKLHHWPTLKQFFFFFLSVRRHIADRPGKTEFKSSASRVRAPWRWQFFAYILRVAEHPFWESINVRQRFNDTLHCGGNRIIL